MLVHSYSSLLALSVAPWAATVSGGVVVVAYVLAVVVVEFHAIFLAICWRFLCACSIDAKQTHALFFSQLIHSFIHSVIYLFSFSKFSTLTLNVKFLYIYINTSFFIYICISLCMLDVLCS